MPQRSNLCARVLDETIVALERAGLDPEQRLALREPKRAWSYGKLQEEVGRAAGALAQLGLAPGDRIVLLMRDGVDLAAALLGALRAGLCAVPVPAGTRPRELLDVLRDAGARAVLAHADLGEQVGQLASAAPALQVVLSLGGSRPGQRDFGALCSQAEPLAMPVLPAPEAPALLLYATSPDGRPRAHGYPHEAALWGFARCASALDLGADDRVLWAGRLASSAGLLLSLLWPLRAGAMSLLLPDGVRGRAVFDVLGSFRPTLFGATPTLFNQLLYEYLEMSAPRPAYFQSVRRAVALGEAMPKDLGRRLRGVFQVEVRPAFLCAEAWSLVLLGEPGAGGGACGRPLPGLEVRVVSDQGQPAAPAEIGQLEVRGPLPYGLWCGLTQRLLPPPEGWVPLPDRFFVDEQGWYFHVGRSDGLFKTQGQLVAPAEVEQVLVGHGAVWECAVVEDESEDGLLQPKAYVVLNVGQEPSGELARELMDFVKRQLSSHKAPRAVEFVHQLPRSADGRVQRWRLRSRPPGAPLSPPGGLLPLKLK